MGEVGEWEMFEILEPASQRIPFVFNSPHSGRAYPQSFLDQSRLDAHSIRRSEDHFVDELFRSATFLGAPLLRAHFPRAFLDVNREPYELDPRMFDGALPAHANISSMRVAGGLGTVPRLVAENMEIYRARFPVEEALTRVETIYKPYHATLRKLIARTHVQFGMAVLIDCHSMPGNVHLPGSVRRPDFIIGDRYGTSAAAELSRIAVELLEQLGYAVTRNKPYAGGFITEHYGNPASGLHTVQLELNRAIYMDERRRERSPRFAQVVADFAALADALAQVPLGDLGPFQAAAE
ncbi:MAG TPA: N-formylglutamate amidohydrolase [Sinorhizobium sp.]|nr:N-formylglutamate amidohydrolase [Sinorhizobium sp.]